MTLFESIVLGKAHISATTVDQFVDEALGYNLSGLDKDQLNIVNIIVGQAPRIYKGADTDNFNSKVIKLKESLMKYRL